MSVNVKPHQAEPLAIIQPDGLGGQTIVTTDVWYNYFTAVDLEINTNIIQNITNVAFSQANDQMTAKFEIGTMKRDVHALQQLVVQPQTTSYQLSVIGGNLSELFNTVAQLRSELAGQKFANKPRLTVVSTAVNYSTVGDVFIEATAELEITLNTTPANLQRVTVQHDATFGEEVTVTGPINDESEIILIVPGDTIDLVYYTDLAKWVIQ